MQRIPFLRDSHNHLFTYSSLFSNNVDLFNITKKNEALSLLNILPSDKLNVATGWLDNYFDFSLQELNDLPPTLLIHNSLHKYIFNDKAEIHIREKLPEFVDNRYNQTWIEKNLMKLLSFAAKLNKFSLSLFEKTRQDFLNKGVCFASDMYVDNTDVFNFLQQYDNQQFTEIWTDYTFYKTLSAEHRNLAAGFKIFLDGAIGAKSAAISDVKVAWNPVLNYTQNELNLELEKLLAEKKDIAIHCIGDVAIEQALNSLTKLKQKINSKIRLEHVQFINKKQAYTAKDLGLILSMQPNFNSDSIIYSDRLTKDFLHANNPFRMLIDDCCFVPGNDLIFGSDGMPSGIFEAINQSLFPPIDGQKLELEEFVSAYCTNSYENFIELEISNLQRKVECKIQLSEGSKNCKDNNY